MERKRRWLTFATSLFITLVLPCLAIAGKPGAGPSVPNTGTITGTVTVGGNPLSGQIFIPGKSFMAKTDSNGSYTLYYVPVGQQNMMIEVPGVLPFLLGGCELTTAGCTVSKNFACLPGEQRACMDCSSVKETCTNEGAWPGCNCSSACSSDPRYGTPCDGDDADLCTGGVWRCDSGGSLVCVGDQPKVEVCDGIDNNCNGLIDEGDLCGAGNVCIQGTCQPVP